MIYRFRIILDTEEDVFRDIEIEQEATLEQFHDVITQSFGFDGTEMASFYISDDKWNQGEEISLFDMSEGSQPVKLMNETLLESGETTPKVSFSLRCHSRTVDVSKHSSCRNTTLDMLFHMATERIKSETGQQPTLDQSPWFGPY